MKGRTTATVAALAVGALVVYGLALPHGDGPAHAWVSGVEYTLAGAAGLGATASDLTRYGQIDRSDDDSVFAEPVAYALRGVDPQAALVVPVKRGMEDVVEPGSDYWLLLGTGSPFPALCPYFIPGAPGTPAECE
jgi:CubicO group peptidase (beta-lactamase class C family)